MINKIYVSAVIPCFERAGELRRLLLSLKKQDFSDSWEIIVVTREHYNNGPHFSRFLHWLKKGSEHSKNYDTIALHQTLRE